MKNAVCTLFVLSAMFSSAAVPVKTIYGWNIWKHQTDGGKVERIKPTAELPQGAMKFLPDPDKKRYSVQWYAVFPAAPTDHLRFVYTFRSAADTNAGVAVALLVRAKDQAGAWCKQPLGERKTVVVEPGKTQEIAIEVDLKKAGTPEIKSFCPMIVVSKLTAGDVTFTGVKVEPAAEPAAK